MLMLTQLAPRRVGRWLAGPAVLAFVATWVDTAPRGALVWGAITAACLVTGAVGLARGRVWGLYANLGAAFVLAGAMPSAAWLAVAAIAAGPFVAHLSPLLRSDRAAAMGLAVAVAASGTVAGWAAAWSAIPTPAIVRLRPPPKRHAPVPIVPAPEKAPPTMRGLEVTARVLEGQRVLLVTLRSVNDEPLLLDVPLADDDERPEHAPLLDPLIRVEAFDGEGTRLQTIQSFGCGMVYSFPKVRLRRLDPGEQESFRLDLPNAWYSPRAVLPAYATGMLMNAREILAAPRAVAVRRVRLRVVYDSAARISSWRGDLSSGLMPIGQQVYGRSEGIPFESLPVDPSMPRDWAGVAEYARQMER